MILAVSRFRVTNGREEAVKEAFFQRPCLVDQEPGFLGMEVFTESKDPAAFYLLTRWTDADSFHRWHSSEAHRISHRQMPRGLKLDRFFNEVIVLDRLKDPGQSLSLGEITVDSASLLAHYLADSQAVHLIVAEVDGTIRACSAAVEAHLKIPAAQLRGQRLWGWLTAADGITLRQRLEQGERTPKERVLLNFVNADQSPYTLECHLDVWPDGCVLIGELPRKQDESFQSELLRLNNELATLTRETARKSRAGEGARRSEGGPGDAGSPGEDGLPGADDRGNRS